MASPQQIEDDATTTFIEWVRSRYGRGWHGVSAGAQNQIEEAFVAGYKEGRKDG